MYLMQRGALSYNRCKIVCNVWAAAAVVVRHDVWRVHCRWWHGDEVVRPKTGRNYRHLLQKRRIKRNVRPKGCTFIYNIPLWKQ